MQADLTPELLSPAGNWDCARAAIAAGADAIFFGLPAFNARLRADNFTEEDLPELMAFLHKHGVQGFLTMNTLIFTNELPAAARQLKLAQEAGVDAFIIQDLGLAKMAQELAPDVEIHASTQMTITAPEGLRFVERILPLERAVLARELSLPEIEKFSREEKHTPLEVFVHGALCVAYSGQCLTSESLGQRSANRGECAQACRMPYELVIDGEVREMGEHRYLLSPQDLAAVDLVPQLVQAGVKSFKIEGRLKSPEYVTAVTRVYRKALDEAMNRPQREPVTAQDRYALEMTFSRGLTTGWLAGTNHPYLTHGRFGKKRGPLLGTVIEAQNSWIRLDTPPADQVPVLKAGDGVVFDAGENRDLEQGATIFRIQDDRIIFHRELSGINWDRIRPGVTLYKTADPALERDLRKFWQKSKLPAAKSGLHLLVSGQPGEALTVTGTLGKLTVQARTETLLQLAQKGGLDEETLQAKLGRLGNTGYELAALENRLQGACHLPVSQLNQVRRELVAQLDAAREQEQAPRPAPKSDHQPLLPPATEPAPTAPPTLTVLCRSEAQVQAALAAGVETIYCDFEDPRRYRQAVALTAATSSQIFLATPRIIKSGEVGYLKHIAGMRPDGVLLRNLAALDFFRDSPLHKVGDFSLNVANPITARLLKEAAHLERLTISYDLNINQVLALLEKTPPAWLELTLHQHMPLFHMEHCVFCTFMSEGTSYKDCGRPCEKHTVHLRDRVGQLHRLAADVGCRNTLFNGRAQTGAGFYGQLRRTGLSHYRIELLDQSEEEARELIDEYQAFLRGEQSSAQLLATLPALSRLGVTEGTLV
ncbi:U32 family peptidase [Roseibacillus ishigakijimensis]|uniref:U32 family peptidase n=1 Tax=Roseibacillus ishigakijimensis TaxID=454146 RepID=A0A934RUE2_9BACT|nr:U32 family peptidase [Roseibacillus ishigakijimensis]MBK1834666.1 U32 family peptidase [Roseibacillus ishigakijimensis]